MPGYSIPKRLRLKIWYCYQPKRSKFHAFRVDEKGSVEAWVLFDLQQLLQRMKESHGLDHELRRMAEAVASVGPLEREGRGLQRLPRRRAGMRPNHLTLSVIDTYSMMYENDHRQCI